MSSTLDPAKLKVVELRAELSKRGLESRGNKPALVKRLKEALEEELKQELPNTSIADTSTEDLDTSQTQNEPAVQESKVPDKELQKTGEEVVFEQEPPANEACVTETEANNEGNLDVAQEALSSDQQAVAPEEPLQVISEEQKSVESSEKTEDVTSSIEENKENGEQVEEPKSRKSRWGSEVEGEETKQNNELENNQSQSVEPMSTDKDAEPKGEKRRRSSPSPDRSQRRRSKSPIKEDEPSIDKDKVQLSWYDSDLHLQVDKSSFLSAKPYHEGAFGFAWAGVRATHGVKAGKVCFEVKITEELQWEDFSKYRREQHKSSYKHKIDDGKKKNDEDSKNKAENMEDKIENTQEGNGDNSDTTENDTKFKESEVKESEAEDTSKNSDEIEAQTGDHTQEEVQTDETKMETEETKMETEESKMELKMPTEEYKMPTEKSTKQTDVSKENAENKEQTEESKEDVENKEQTETENKELLEPLPTHLFRVGWSLLKTSLQLGEEEYSYGYESSGTFVVNKHFEDYGIKFGVGDVIASFLNIDDTGVSVSYSVNGVPLPEAKFIPKAELPDNFTLFPHVLSRNYAFELNLGSKEQAWFAKAEQFQGYEFLEKIEDKVAGPVRPENRGDCEVILMCGLPASGKTHWVEEYIQSNPDKKYTVLGNTHLLQKMTVSGDALKSKYKGSWNMLLEKLQKCINKLIEIAALRRRNYIIDQPNVFPSAQRRKLRLFEGFKRRAVVVVVGDEEQSKRQSLQEAQGGKDVPDSTVLDMKANMSLPQKSEWLDEVIYVGVNEEEAKTLVQKYNSQARETMNVQRRFSHRDDRHRWQNRRNDYRGGNYRERSYHNNRYDRGPPRQGNWHPQRPGGWNRDRRDNRGPPMGGSRDWRNRGNGRDRVNRDAHNQTSTYNRNRNNQVGRGPGGNWSTGWGQNQGSWSNQPWGGQGSWNQSNWNNPNNQNHWKYGGGNQSYGNYSNWNYYGQYAQNWSSQAQPHSAGNAAANQYGQYSQQDWAQYAQQYAQQGQTAPGSVATQSTLQK